MSGIAEFETEKSPMFRLAIVGPVPGGSFGLARQCMQCHLGGRSTGGPACRGFGAGCLRYGSKALAVPANDFVRFDAGRLARR
jgi:hypothetical protein